MKAFLSRMEYPCTAEDLRAQGRRDSVEDWQVLEVLPQRTYHGARDVLQELSSSRATVSLPAHRVS